MPEAFQLYRLTPQQAQKWQNALKRLPGQRQVQNGSQDLTARTFQTINGLILSLSPRLVSTQVRAELLTLNRQRFLNTVPTEPWQKRFNHIYQQAENELRWSQIGFWSWALLPWLVLTMVTVLLALKLDRLQTILKTTLKLLQPEFSAEQKKLNLAQLNEAIREGVRRLRQALVEEQQKVLSVQARAVGVEKELARLEKEVEKAQRLHQQLWQNAPDGFVLLDESQRIVDASAAFVRLTRLSLQDLLHKKMETVFKGHEQPRWREFFNSADATAREIEIDLWYGEKHFLQIVRAEVELPDSGRHFLLFVRDVSLWKNAIAELSRSEKRFRMLFNNANDPVFVNHLNAEHRFENFLEVNQSACNTYLYSREEFRHLNPLTLVPADFQEEHQAALNRLLQEGHVIYEIEHLRKDKRRIPVEISAHLFEYKNQPTVLSIVRDISERKRTQEALRQSGLQLRRLASRLQDIREEERTMIAREIHDELGQLLTVLKIDVTLLCNRFLPQNKETRQKVESISGLINQAVEAVQRISAKLRPGILDELGLIAALEWQAQEFSRHTGIPCKVSLPEKEMEIDREKATALFRIFQEALTNVARHAQAGRVSVFLKYLDGRVTLEVIDNGRGITRQQIDSAQSLGLLGMRERALVFGGDVQINGVPGKGTQVKVEMPLG